MSVRARPTNTTYRPFFRVCWADVKTPKRRNDKMQSKKENTDCFTFGCLNMITETRDRRLALPTCRIRGANTHTYVYRCCFCSAYREAKNEPWKNLYTLDLAPQSRALTKMSEKTHTKKSENARESRSTNLPIEPYRFGVMSIFFVHSCFFRFNFLARCFRRHVLVCSCASYTAMHNVLPHLMLLINFRLFYCFVGPSFI